MIAKRHLPNAPIQEALIDFRVALPDELTLDDLSGMQQKVHAEYPVIKTIKHGMLGFQLLDNQEPKTSIESTTIGYRCESEDGSQIVQFRMNGFTFSKLPPYQDWDTMQREAERLWDIYKSTMNPVVVTRVATRFINVMRFPLPLERLSEYLTAPPNVPVTLPQALSSFLTRMVVPEPEAGCTAIITQALESVEDDVVPIVLDIDVFASCQHDVADNEYWTLLRRMREFKNNIFFESITEKAAELFK